MKIRAFKAVVCLLALPGLAGLARAETEAAASGEPYEFVLSWAGDYAWQPFGVAVSGGGTVYVVDKGADRVQTFTASGEALPAAWGSYGSGDGQFKDPLAIAVDANGYVYVADTGNSRVQKFDSSGQFVSKWGSCGSAPGKFCYPSGITVDEQGNVYVTDGTYGRVAKFDAAGAFVTQWGTKGSGDGQFQAPHGIAVDADGNVFVADETTHRVQKFDSSGTFQAKWGTPGSGEGQLQNPWGVAVDASGHVYVTDAYNYRVQKFDSSGGFLAAFGSFGSGDGQFDLAFGLAVGASGDVYVADTGNHRIVKFRPATVPPLPDVKVNGSDGPVTVSRAAALNVSVELAAGSWAGEPVDWWVVAATPLRERYYHYDWAEAGWLPGLAVSDQGPAADRGPETVLTQSGLPAGDYVFYFGLDPVMDGRLDLEAAVYEQVKVRVTR